MRSLFACSFILIFLASCGEDDPTVKLESDNLSIIDDLEYERVSHPATITAATIEGSYLNVTIGFSGCDDTVTVRLVGEEKISKSNPPQRNLKLQVNDAGDCLAFFTKTLSFDLSPFLSGEEHMDFNLEGWERKLIHGLNPEECDTLTLVDGEAFKKESHPVQIQEVVLEGDCLELTFAFSGCSDDIGIQLVDKDIVAESNPPQCYLRLILEDAGLCTAAFSKTMSFDLTPSRVKGGDAVIFHLEGWEDWLLYNY